MRETVDDALEVRGLAGQSDGERRRRAEDAEVGLEHAVEGGRLGADKDSEEAVQRRRFDESLFDKGGVVLQPVRASASVAVIARGAPDEERLEGGRGPERIREEAEVEGEAFVLPEEMATGLARGKVEQDRQGKLLERRVVLDESEQDRNRACTGSFLLPGLGQSTQVEQSSDDFL